MALFKIQVNLSSFSLLNSYVGHSGTSMYIYIYIYEPNSTVAQLRFRLFLILKKLANPARDFGVSFI